MKHLLDIDVLSSSGPPHDAYAEVRAREPVSWQEMPGVGGYWASQILPFQDATSYPGFVDFQTAVYRNLRN
mgnify:CR=1 FL=1